MDDLDRHPQSVGRERGVHGAHAAHAETADDPVRAHAGGIAGAGGLDPRAGTGSAHGIRSFGGRRPGGERLGVPYAG